MRSQAAMPAGPETKSMASRAMAYRSACIASGVNRSRARLRARDAAAGSAACDTPGPAAAVARRSSGPASSVIVAIAGRAGSAPSRVMPAAASARAMILSTTRMSACPVTTGSATASQAAASASFPVR